MNKLTEQEKAFVRWFWPRRPTQRHTSWELPEEADWEAARSLNSKGLLHIYYPDDESYIEDEEATADWAMNISESGTVEDLIAALERELENE